MKDVVIFLTIVLFSGCLQPTIGEKEPNLPLDPVYVYGDLVDYRMDDFYRSVCSGKGKVEGKHYSRTVVQYVLRVSEEEIEAGCPPNQILRFKKKAGE